LTDEPKVRVIIMTETIPDGRGERVFEGTATESGLDKIIEAAQDADNWAVHGIA